MQNVYGKSRWNPLSWGTWTWLSHIYHNTGIFQLRQLNDYKQNEHSVSFDNNFRQLSRHKSVSENCWIVTTVHDNNIFVRVLHNIYFSVIKHTAFNCRKIYRAAVFISRVLSAKYEFGDTVVTFESASWLATASPGTRCGICKFISIRIFLK